MIPDDEDFFWARVHASLDDRDDPLDDPEVVAALKAHPERLQEHSRLIAALRVLPRTRRAVRRTAGRVAALAGLAAAAGLALWLWPRSDPAGALPAGDPLRVLHLRVVHASPDGENTFERSRAGTDRFKIALAPGGRILRQVVETARYTQEVPR